MEASMNVLEMIRTKAQRTEALKQAQAAVTRAVPIYLVYRGIKYQKAP